MKAPCRSGIGGRWWHRRNRMEWCRRIWLCVGDAHCRRVFGVEPCLVFHLGCGWRVECWGCKRGWPLMLIVFRVEMADVPMGKFSRRLYMIVFLLRCRILCHHLFTDLDSPRSEVSCCISTNSFFSAITERNTPLSPEIFGIVMEY